MPKNNRGFWDKQECFKAASICKTKNEFQKRFSGAYKASLKNKWIDEITSHLIIKKNKNNYWDKNKCITEASKFTNRTDFAKKSCAAYKAAQRNNWLDEICYHMITRGDKYKRYTYVYEFLDKHVYVGLTCDIDRRKLEHSINCKSPVYKHSNLTKSTPRLIINSLKDLSEAQTEEKFLISEYKQNGWVLLNKSKGGGIGNIKTKWNQDKCQVEAIKYKTRLEFQKNASTAYKFCLKNNILNHVCSHMIKKNHNKIVNFKCTKDKCLQEALKYKTKKEFYTNSQNAYRFSIRNNFLSEICGHMIK